MHAPRISLILLVSAVLLGCWVLIDESFQGYERAGSDAGDDGDARRVNETGSDVDTSDRIAAPRLVAPLSTTTVFTRRPTLRWVLAAGTDGARIEICRDRACTDVVSDLSVSGTSGAPASDLPAGVLFWRALGRSSGATGSSASPTWQFMVRARKTAIDSAWGTTLDANGDGHADVLVGADSVENATGRAYLYYGGRSGLTPAPKQELRGPDGRYGYFGHSVASAGDVNGDGYADVIVGAYAAFDDAGGVHLYLGGETELKTSAQATLIGPGGAFGQFGWSLASAGDINRDGYADVIVGAPSVVDPDGEQVTGGAYIYYGRPDGLSTSQDLTLVSAAVNTAFGSAVDGAGDIDGDGHADVAVADPNVDVNTGRVYVYRGTSQGLDASAPRVLTGPDGTGANFGSAIAGGADIDGDGYADLIVGAARANFGAGRVRVYRGGPEGLGRRDNVPVAGALLEAPDGNLFGYAVANAGDVNADGYDDVLVGAFDVDHANGRAYLYWGGAQGLDPKSVKVFYSPAGAAGRFGASLASAGDVDADGKIDLLIGAPFVNDDAGAVYLYTAVATSAGSPEPSLELVSRETGGRFGTSLARLDGLREEFPY